MKKLFLILFLIFFGLSMRAEIKLVIWGKDGSQVAFALSEQPQLHFYEDNTITVSSLSSEQKFTLSEIRKYTFEGLDDAGYRNLEDDRASSFKFDGELLLFPALKAGTTVIAGTEYDVAHVKWGGSSTTGRRSYCQREVDAGCDEVGLGFDIASRC